jgi:hypothetical protein
MIFNISGYEQVWFSNDFTTVYGSSTWIDNSQGCVHSNQDTTVTLITPDGSRYSANGYMSAWTSGSSGDGGEYTADGLLLFRCSCSGNVGVGGDTSCLARVHTEGDGEASERSTAAGRPRTRPSDATLIEAGGSSPRPKRVEVANVVTVSLAGKGRQGVAGHVIQ